MAGARDHAADGRTDYGVGLSQTSPREGRADGRTDAEVLASARRASAFPTLLEAFPATPEGPRRPVSARERRAAKRAFRHDLKEAGRKAREAGRDHRAAQKAERQRYKSLSRQLRERDRELSRGSEELRRRRRAARSVYDAIGFDRMFSNGVCEVESGLYSETVEFSDVSYQSAVEESQRATFNALAQLLDWFGADTMVQYSVSNVPIPEDEVGHRAFFDPAAAGENAALAEQFNAILNRKVLECRAAN